MTDECGNPLPDEEDLYGAKHVLKNLNSKRKKSGNLDLADVIESSTESSERSVAGSDDDDGMIKLISGLESGPDSLSILQLFPNSSMKAGCEECQRRATIPHTFRWNGVATQVLLTGSFLNWSTKLFMHKVDDRQWVYDIKLPRGHHEYIFIVDSKWVFDRQKPILVTSEGKIHNYFHL
ncbi:hypothetical protein AB6A40_007158 [Gnathostoma spinigerum]|uniref:5'-AMP-activated protein kinase subunit beta-1 n=1 Tax=Gnathostoma spinigerum TaxID=75299 RepID=A0ABD6ET27_9BILA